MRPAANAMADGDIEGGKVLKTTRNALTRRPVGAQP